MSSPACVKPGFGKWLSYTRRSQALSQEDFAARIGVGARTIRAWEASEITPSARSLRLIAAATDVQLLDLLALGSRRAAAIAPAARAHRMTAVTGAPRPDPTVATRALLAGPSASAEPSPQTRLAGLCDVDSLAVTRSAVRSAKVGNRAVGGDGVLGAAGRVGGRPVVCYAQDVRFLGGSVGAAHSATIARILRQAARTQVPVIGFVESAGARMQEGLAALDGYAEIFYEHVALSGVVPQLSILTGTCAGGASYSPALTDFVIMTHAAATFLTGPQILRELTGEAVSAAELGGPDVHSRNGVAHLVAATEQEATILAQRLLSFLPQHAGALLPLAEPVAAEVADPSRGVPADPRRPYDVRDVISGIVDAGSALEIQPDWAPNIIVSLARIEGRPVGVVANQPRVRAGVIDADASQKAARFVRTSNAFGIPLVVLVDTPGFMPGRAQEEAGVIRHGAELLHAFAEATVTRVTVVLRKAFGGAYITMNSRSLGADLVLAWEMAQLGIVGAAQAVGIIHRRELAAASSSDVREQLVAAYTRDHLGADAAASGGHVDEVIAPRETRRRLADALAGAAGRPRDRHRVRNIPL